jgi:hypothetical protein
MGSRNHVAAGLAAASISGRLLFWMQSQPVDDFVSGLSGIEQPVRLLGA